MTCAVGRKEGEALNSHTCFSSILTSTLISLISLISHKSNVPVFPRFSTLPKNTGLVRIERV